MTLLFALGLLGCDRFKGDRTSPTETLTTPTDDWGTIPFDGGSPDGGSPDGGSPDGGSPDGGSTTTEPLPDLPGATCPPPPDDAVVFHAGTLVADQSYVSWDPESYITEDGVQHGWHLIASGLSYTHEQSCADMAWGNRIFDDIKAGLAPNEFWFELTLFIPGLEHKGWLGEHTLGHEGPYLGPNNVGHNLRIGWRDSGATYPSMVNSLPNGWTESKVCVGFISPDYLYLTVLWDPKDGPYTTNDFVRTDRPIWFDMEIWPTGGSDPSDPEGSKHRSCALTNSAFLSGSPYTKAEELFEGYSWPAKDFP